MLYPKQSKYLKSHTILDKSTFVVYNENLCFGSYGLVALQSGYLSPEELEAVRRVAVRTFRGIIRI
jgi:ribosomal protein L16/L10AE